MSESESEGGPDETPGYSTFEESLGELTPEQQEAFRTLFDTDVGHRLGKLLFVVVDKRVLELVEPLHQRLKRMEEGWKMAAEQLRYARDLIAEENGRGRPED